MEDLGTNVKADVKGNELTIKVDLSQNFGLSPSGKTYTVGTSHGFKNVTKDIAISLNVNKKKAA